MPAISPRLSPITMPVLPAPGRRAAGFGALLVAVGLVHQQSLGTLAEWLARPALRAPASRVAAPALQLVTRASAPAATPPLRQPPQPTVHRMPAPAAARTKPRPIALARALTPVTAQTPPAAAEADPPAAQAEAATPTTVLPSIARTPPPEPPTDAAGADPEPPVYPTRPPPTAVLHFSVQRGRVQGTGQWLWQADGPHYSSRLQAELAGRPALDHLSRGAFDGAGLAPERMVEQQRERAVRAVNFQRDKGVVSFSGSTRQWLLHRGTQDRASWLPQLLAVVGGRGQAWSRGDPVSLAVAGPRGDLDEWRFVMADETPTAQPRRGLAGPRPAPLAAGAAVAGGAWRRTCAVGAGGSATLTTAP